ncbi:MAG: methyltransferase [Ginsengibacter sp.]
MRNTYFQFKQFKINQEKSSLKVCTDSCLLGALLAKKIEEKEICPNSILDIGAGTGLLSLMLAQKTDALIDAVEIDDYSFEEMNSNFSQSPWHEQLQAFNADIKSFKSEKKYDFIISNPPFFENSLKSQHAQKNIAKHQDGLTLEELLGCIKSLLNESGIFALLLPFHRAEYFKSIAQEQGYFLKEEFQIKQTPAHSYFRSILLFSIEKMDTKFQSLMIKNENEVYNPIFKNLLEDYYL